jgi:hypothetical protein
MRIHSLLLLTLLSAALLSAAGCGGSDDSGAEDLARQHELSAARHQAAQDARQSARIKQLEGELEHTQRGGSAAVAEPPAAAEDPINSTAEWPGESGYTVILASLESEAAALEGRREAIADGLDAGILYSSEFSSLQPGYWVVFSGVFASGQEAQARVSAAHDVGYSDAYPRFVSP